LRTQLSSIHETGAELIIIGNGKPHHAESFRRDMQMTSPLYVDPKMGTYRALNLRNGIWYTFTPAAWLMAFRAYRQGYRITGVKSDPWQQGGTFVVLPNGEVPYHYISKHSGDHPPAQDFLAALRSAVKQV
jgi:hypothetical protein